MAARKAVKAKAAGGQEVKLSAQYGYAATKPANAIKVFYTKQDIAAAKRARMVKSMKDAALNIALAAALVVFLAISGKSSTQSVQSGIVAGVVAGAMATRGRR